MTVYDSFNLPFPVLDLIPKRVAEALQLSTERLDLSPTFGVQRTSFERPGVSNFLPTEPKSFPNVLILDQIRMIRFKYLMLVDICCCWVFFWYCNFAFLHTKPWRWNSAKRFGESWQNKIQNGTWPTRLLGRSRTVDSEIFLHQLRGLQHCN